MYATARLVIITKRGTWDIWHDYRMYHTSLRYCFRRHKDAPFGNIVQRSAVPAQIRKRACAWKRNLLNR